MAHVHLITGPVGAGKSTFGIALSHELGALRLTLDDWMARLYGADERPAEGRIAWYIERRDRVLDQIWEVAQQALALGTPVVLEIGLIQAAERAAFYGRVDAVAAELSVYVIDAPRDVRRRRVMRRNEEKGRTYAVDVPLPFFELASDLWQPPDEMERAERRVIVPEG